MHFSKDTIQYALATWDQFTHDEITSHAEKPLPITGLYNWKNALNGSFAFPRNADEMERFNVFHLNLTARNISLISRIRKIVDPNKTILLANVDYAVELWANNFPFPDIFWQELDRCDKIFSVEESMAELIGEKLHRYVPTIPHPCDTLSLKGFIKHNRSTTVGVSIHRYDSNFYLPALAIDLANLPPHFTTSAFGSLEKGPQFLHLYDNVFPIMDFETTISAIADILCMVESYTISSYGRMSIECATLGVPCIGSSKVSSIRRCFPELITEPNQFKRTAELIHALCTDTKFHSTNAKSGMKESEYYSFDSCTSKLLDFLNSEKD